MKPPLKLKTCKQCKQKFTPTKPLQSICGYLCAIDYQKVQQQKKMVKEWRIEKSQIKEKIKTLSDYEKDAKKEFQAWVRRRDADLPCISCGKTSNRYDGGHYFDAGIYSGLIFHEWNVNKQCSYNCNKMLHGNKPNYRVGLVKKIGEDNVRWLEENKDRLRNHKYTKSELLEIKEKYKALLK